MKCEITPTTPLEDMPNLLSIKEVSVYTRMTEYTIRKGVLRRRLRQRQGCRSMENSEGGIRRRAFPALSTS